MPTMTNLVVLLVIYNINILGNILFYIRYISSREQNPHDRRRALAISDGDFLSLLLKQYINCRMGVSGQDAERRFRKKKAGPGKESRASVCASLELHSRSSWMFHMNIKIAVDCYLEVEPCDAQKQEPGRALADASITGDGFFEF